MTFLLDVQGVKTFASYIWGNDPLVTPEQCITTLPWMPEACWSRLLVKLLGLAIIVGSCLNKFPIILNIISTKSTIGLSRAAIYGEIVVYLNCALYGMLESYPMSAYGENVMLTIQSIGILLLIYRHTATSASEQVFAAAVSVAYVTAIITLIPPKYYYVLMASVWPVQVFSRGSQILQTFRLKHTGTQSAVTNGMNLAGSCIRILTTIKEVGWDWAVLMGYVLSVGLNGALLLQFVMYRDNTRQFWLSLKDKKQD
jgi:mannose-P-dolichol utilization defect 1